ncbi:alpha/beta hydrolase [Rothia sp. AR01]|uniref:Alpha/beta hydrolase n=1 Tax=Rothia santali TaxID=2949643 RepID=A0A9X2KJG6_9MICC|nr:alpha/beta hydrolase [Rothia santali]MCP3426819.1 alpha/beta hydrolase [Rothia santali]
MPHESPLPVQAAPAEVFEAAEGPAYFPRESSFVHDAARVRYWTYPSLLPGAPRLVMVHGFRGDHHGMALIAEPLRAGWEVVVPDLPGFGASEPLTTRPHTAREYAAVVGELIDRLGGGPVAVVGHSFGSVVAARLAAGRPRRVSALALVNPICEPALESGARVPALAASLFYRICALLPGRAGDALVRSRTITRVSSEVMMKNRHPGLRAFINGQHAAYFGAFSSRRTVLEAYGSSIRDTVRDVAPSVACPVLLVAAERDDLGSVEGQRDLAGRFPDARLEVIPDVGHLIHYETPRRAAALVEGFLRGAGRAA